MRTFSLLTFLSIVIFSSTLCQADSRLQEKLSLLSKIAAALESNYNRLKTWEAVYDVSDTRNEQVNLLNLDGLEEVKIARVSRTGTVSFACDFQSNRVVTNFLENPESTKVVEGDVTFYRDHRLHAKPIEVSALLREGKKDSIDRSIDMGPFRDFEGDPYNLTNQSAPVAKTIEYDVARDNDFDFEICPQEFYRSGSGFLLHQLLGVTRDALNGKYGTAHFERTHRCSEVSMSPDGKSVLAKLSFCEGSPSNSADTIVLVQELTFSTEPEFLPVLYREVDGKSGELVREKRWEWQLDRESNIYIPAKYSLAGTGATKIAREFSLESSELNGSVSSEVYLDSLELREGERLLDKERGKMFINRNGRMEEIPQVLPDMSSRSRYRALAFLSLAVLTGYFAFRKLR